MKHQKKLFSTQNVTEAPLYIGIYVCVTEGKNSFI